MIRNVGIPNFSQIKKSSNEQIEEDAMAHGTHVTDDSVVINNKYSKRLLQEKRDKHSDIVLFISVTRWAVQHKKTNNKPAGVNIPEKMMNRIKDDKNVQETLKIAKNNNISVEVYENKYPMYGWQDP